MLRNAEGEPIGWQLHNVMGLYAHGLFEAAPVLVALFDGLADFIGRHFEFGALLRLLES